MIISAYLGELFLGAMPLSLLLGWVVHQVLHHRSDRLAPGLSFDLRLAHAVSLALYFLVLLMGGCVGILIWLAQAHSAR